MTELEDNSVQCVVTSPPYWGLRKYAGEQDLIWTDNWRGAYGLEPSPELYVQHTIEILREIRRVLRKDGVMFWNIGDSYMGSGCGTNDYRTEASRSINKTDKYFTKQPPQQKRHSILKPKDLCLIPFRVALAVQADGWWVRSVIIWSKQNPMPESVKDRPTESHEYILLLTKSAKYYWDMEAVREAAQPESYTRYESGFKMPKHRARKEQGYNSFLNDTPELNPAGRNIRSVWTFATQPYPEAHFATFPEALPEKCIKAGSSEKGCCPKCGNPWERVVEKIKSKPRTVVSPHAAPPGQRAQGSLSYERYDKTAELQTIGWQPSCKCDAGKPVPSIVLDPFAGAGTTLIVAERLGRTGIGYELSSEYCKLIETRYKQNLPKIEKARAQLRLIP